MRRLVWTFALWLCLPGWGATAPLEGVVTRVADGDTLTVTGSSVRLQGIDAPERDQPHGNEAAASLRSVVLNRVVRLDVQGIDRYDRLIAVVYRDGRNINRWLVRQGHAWEYDRHSEDHMLAPLEWLACVEPTGRRRVKVVKFEMPVPSARSL